MGVTHTFVSIERDEYHKLYDYVRDKRLRIKNIEDNDATYREKMEDIWSSSDESHDAYLNKVKAEGRERTAEAAAAAVGTFAGADFSDDDDEDEDFNPPEMDSSESDIAEEYDSNAESSDSYSSAGSESGSSVSERRHKRSKPKKSAVVSRKSEKKSKKDPNAPTRPPTAYLLWFNENRQKIKDSLGSSAGVVDVARAAGEKWKTLDKEVKAKYQGLADKLRERYEEEVKEYKSKLASGEISPPPEKSKKQEKSKIFTPKKSSGGGGSSSQSGAFKSAEYVSDSSSSSENRKRGGDDVEDDLMSDLSD